MKSVFITLFLIIAAVSASRYNYDHDSDDVNILALNKLSFEQVRIDYSYVLVKFWSPACPYSRRFAPEYIKARSLVCNNAYSDAVFTSVNIKTEIDIKRQFNILATPTTRLFVKNQNTWINYEGERRYDALSGWVKTRIDSDRIFNKHIDHSSNSGSDSSDDKVIVNHNGRHYGKH